jgi:hypothetical protein
LSLQTLKEREYIRLLLLSYLVTNYFCPFLSDPPFMTRFGPNYR